MSSMKLRPFCLGLNVFERQFTHDSVNINMINARCGQCGRLDSNCCCELGVTYDEYSWWKVSSSLPRQNRFDCEPNWSFRYMIQLRPKNTHHCKSCLILGHVRPINLTAFMMTSSNWTHFPRYWPFVREIHRYPVISPHKGQWRGALMFSLICI